MLPAELWRDNSLIRQFDVFDWKSFGPVLGLILHPEPSSDFRGTFSLLQICLMIMVV